MVSGVRRTIREFALDDSGFSKSGDTIPFPEVSSLYAQGGYDPVMGAFVFFYTTGIMSALGATFDGIQYLASEDKGFKPTAGFALGGAVVGVALASMARKRFELFIQPVVLDTNQVPY